MWGTDHVTVIAGTLRDGQGETGAGQAPAKSQGKEGPHTGAERH